MPKAGKSSGGKKRKKKEKEPPPLPGQCSVAGCPHMEIGEGVHFCYFHYMLDRARNFAENAFDGGRPLEGFAGLGAAAIVQRLFKGGPEAPPQGPPPPRPGNGGMPLLQACAVLGVDIRKVKADEVRTLQRELAKLYHPDRCGKGVSEAKMREINAAAEVCLEHLRGRP